MLITKTVKIKWSGKNKIYYVNKGYHFTKIKDEFEVKIEDLTFGSDVIVEFICDYCDGKNQIDDKSKFKIYRQYINSRKSTNADSCNHPSCRGRKISESQVSKEIKVDTQLGIKFPNLVKEWSDKNLISPFDVSFGMDMVAWWKCPKCKSDYEMKICHKTSQNLGCPYCSGHRVNETNSLATTHPHLLSEWNYELNKNLSPHDVTKGSSKSVWWRCKKGHEWEDKVTERTSTNRKCPYCFGRKVNNENSLLVTHPNLIKEIHPTLNNDFDPSKVKQGSGKKIWWVCEKGHEWKVSICDRTFSKTGCPYCSNKKVCEDNCLQTVNSDLAEEWDYELNVLKPKDVTGKSKKIIWWKCKKCSNSWKSTVLGRAYGNGCPICNESKGEKVIREWLKNNKIEFESQKIFKDLIGIGGGNLTFDFYIKNKNKLIEYDGEYHYLPIKLYKNEPIQTAQDRLKKQQYHDDLKNKYANKHKLELIRISYLNFKKIEDILKESLIDD